MSRVFLGGRIPVYPYKESDEQLMNFGLRDQLEALRWIQEMLCLDRFVWIGLEVGKVGTLVVKSWES